MLITRSRNRSLFLPVSALASLVFLSLAGCGGSSHSGPIIDPVPSPTASASPNPGNTTRATFAIHWGARSRTISAPSSALSVKVTIAGGRSDGSDLVQILDRGDSLADYVQNVTTDEGVTPGTHPISISAYAQHGGDGSLVGYATTSTTIAADGSGLGDVALTGTVTSVVVNPGQTINLGATKSIGFVCKDANGITVLATPGSAFLSVVDGGQYIHLVDNRVQGVAPGIATVQYTVDGVTSAPVAVQVTTPTTVSIDPTSTTIFVGDSATFSATVANTMNTGVTWSVQEGASGGTISSSGVYQAPSTPGIYHVVATSVYDPTKQAVAAVTVQTEGTRTVYQNEFDATPGGEWSNVKTDTTPLGARKFLGRFGPESTKLKLTNLPPHSSITVTFKLFIIRSMDGNTVINVNGDLSGPDIWSLSLDGSLLTRTSFSNWEAGGTTSPPSPQSYPGQFGAGDFPARTGASENNTLGYDSYKPAYIGPIQDSVYDLSYTLPHTGSTATFEFKSEQKEDADNESWGIDAINVSVSGR